MDLLTKAKEQFKGKPPATKLVVYLGLLGMGLILVCSFFDTDSSVQVASSQTVLAVEGEGVTTIAISTEESYRNALEENLADLISQLDGAGQTAVMITLTSGEQTVYAQNTTQSDTQSSQSHVILEDGSALSETVLTPTVCGVVVLCEGGDNIVVEAKITAMVTALFDIASNHVSVEKLA